MKNVSTLTTSALIALTIAGAGVTAIAAPTAQTKSAAPSSEAISAATSKISLNQAINIAKQHAKGDLIGAEFDYDDDDNRAAGEYEVEFIAKDTSYEVKIEANSGRVLEVESERLDQEDKTEYRAMRQAKVTLNSALQKAAQSVNGTVIGFEFELEDNQSLYDIKLAKNNQKYEVSIDANSGQVLSRQIDMDDDD